jgi:hypothetical protein
MQLEISTTIFRLIPAGIIPTVELKESPNDYPLDHVAPVFGKLGVTGRWGNFTGEMLPCIMEQKTLPIII